LFYALICQRIIIILKKFIMLFIILIVFLWVFQVVGSGLLIYFRKEPSIKLRELTLSLLYTFILTLHCTFTGVVLERFYVGETWKGYCSMLSWSLVLSTPGIIWVRDLLNSYFKTLNSIQK